MMGSSGGMFFGGGFMWIFWLLVVVVILAAAKAVKGRNGKRDDSQKDSALSILDERYARGEIGREEYEEKRRELER